MPGLAQVRSLPEAFAVIKQMQLRGWEWSEDAYAAGRHGMAALIGERMTKFIDQHLVEFEERGEDDRRNGFYRRHLLTALGDVELAVPRTRTTSAVHVLQAFARRTPEVDRLVLACFVLGLSTRKVGEALLPILGERISPESVSRVCTSLDAAVRSFHQRRLQNCYRVLLFDGVVLKRKTGMGTTKRYVLVALGLRPDGKREVIDFEIAKSESAAAWEHFLTALQRRGLTGEGVELITVDGGQGLLAALEIAYPDTPVQRCWAHKVRNILDKVRVKDWEAVKRDLRKIYLAARESTARNRARRFAERWAGTYPSAVQCLKVDLDALLQHYRFADATWRKWTRTTNAIERRFREVRRRTRPMGVMENSTSMDRILFAVFTHENRMQGVAPLFALTQNN